MANYKKYKGALEKLGLKQLDVYRYKDKDVIRVLRTQDNKVFLVELLKHREEMSVEDYINLIKTKIR
jgi:VIT1/CCC1 family predicted Fe2+/Mn2+ transporter